MNTLTVITVDTLLAVLGGFAEVADSRHVRLRGITPAQEARMIFLAREAYRIAWSIDPTGRKRLSHGTYAVIAKRVGLSREAVIGRLRIRTSQWRVI